MRPAQSVEQGTALAEIIRTITVSLDAGTVFKVLERETQSILAHSGLWVLICSPQPSPEQWTLAFSTHPHHVLNQGWNLNEASFSASILANQTVVVVDFATTAGGARLDQAVVDDGGRAGVVVPIHVGSKVLGALLLTDATPARLGGRLNVLSTPGHGTRVEVNLPYVRAPLAGLVRVSRGEKTSPTQPIRVLVVDDHPVTRQGLQRILEGQPDLEVVGEAEDGLAAVEKTRALHPDVVLLDLQMPKLGGLAALLQLRAAQPQVEVVVLTTFDQEEHVFAALKAGARGYLLKDTAPEMLLTTIRAAARGESLLPPALTTRVVNRFVALAQRETDPDALNAREMEVLTLMATGAPYKVIATQLHITPKTVQYHVGNILGKLQVRSRGEAVAVATERGLLGAKA